MHCLKLLALIPLTVARASLAASDLVVEVDCPDGNTGTMHYADGLTLTAPCAPPLRLEGKAAQDGTLLPLPGPSFRLPGARYLLLGWSSSGGGLQGVHALLLACGDERLRLVDRLDVVTDRAHAGLLVQQDADGSVALGLPPPPEAPLHEPAAWSLSDSGGASALTLESMRRFVYVPLPSNRADPFYAPPAQLGRRPQRVAWIRVSAGGFVLPAEPGASAAP